MVQTRPRRSPLPKLDTWTSSNLAPPLRVQEEIISPKEHQKSQWLVSSSRPRSLNSYQRWLLIRTHATQPLKVANSTLNYSSISFRRSLSRRKNKDNLIQSPSQRSLIQLRLRNLLPRRKTQRNTLNAVQETLRTFKSQTWWLSPSVPTCRESTTPRICARHATASLVATRTLSTVSTLTDYFTPWVCVKPAISPTTIREEPRLRERLNSSRLRPKRRLREWPQRIQPCPTLRVLKNPQSLKKSE